jgi:hypothetical protein
LRLPAQEIEGHVVSAIGQFLADAQAVTAQLCIGDAPPAVASAAIRMAASFSVRLHADGGREHYEAIRAVVAHVQVDDITICVTLKRRSLAEQLGIAFDAILQDVDVPLELNIPAQLRRLGKEKRLIVAAHAPRSHPDAVLIKAIVRAHQWFGMLRNRTITSITDISKAERLSRSYVSSIIPFAFLAPDIVEAILDGTQPIDLNLDRLINLALPLDWTAQRAVLGFK